MSRLHLVKLTCPHCQAENEAAVWDSINAQLDPQAKEQLLEGKINILTCSRCGVSSPIDAPLLYHDMEKEFGVEYYPFKSINDDNFLAGFNADGSLKPDDKLPIDVKQHYLFQPHYVFSMDELVRYILFRDKLAE